MIRELLEKIKLFETGLSPEEIARFQKRRAEDEEKARFQKRRAEDEAKAKAEADAKAKAEADAKAKADADAKAKEEQDAKQKQQQKTLLPVDKNVKALQDEIVTAGGKFPKYGADGRWGNETAGVVFSDPKFVEIARKYANTIPQVKSILSAKDFAKDVGARADATIPPVVSANNASNSAAQAASANDDDRINNLVDARMKAQQDAAAKAAKDAQLKALIKEPEAGTTGYSISPKNGMIYYTGPGKNNNQPAPLRLQDVNSGLYKDIFSMIKDAGLTVKGTPPRQSWTDWGEGYAMIDPNQLSSVGQSNSAAQADNSVETNPYSLNYGNPKSSTPGLKDPSLEFQKQMRAQAMKSPPPTPLDVKESVGFQADELNRIVSLIHYR
jgi:hypothetical protein